MDFCILKFGLNHEPHYIGRNPKPMDRLIDIQHHSIFYRKNVNLLLVELAHTQLWLVVILEYRPIKAQIWDFMSIITQSMLKLHYFGW